MYAFRHKLGMFGMICLALLCALFVPTATALAETRTGPNDTIAFGKYFVQNNQWGKQYNNWGDGYQSITHDASQDGSGAWSTDFHWWNVLSDDAWHIKAWPSIVCGWQWGSWSNNSGLPVHLWDNKNVVTSWHFRMNGGSSYRADAAYDLWLHDESDWYWPTDEIMIWPWWTDEETGAHNGTHIATVTIGGATWDVYKDWASNAQSPRGGWTFWKFIRQGTTTQIDGLNIKDFLMYLQWGLPDGVERVPNARYLTSIQAGSEIWYGNGWFATDLFSVDIS
ncbi:glycosyl hydrolase family 12 [Thermosporothrix hazakensis]|jgi:hypothetical protein|uniref:Glycosyl hydrolase family 12 n=1 Tax=Thermosporothrix hazakensis TaxID=644383 RepID=A0A326U2U1_THEHA|nr:hypothetical protein [Thermosporothrix hazakensis]PZW25286.1 glycosyl hydrolase family 12 [Thermosporothrix hazakensis]GCE50518.1 glycoside hydrolase [Thermosporothrix hazakensis]